MEEKGINIYLKFLNTSSRHVLGCGGDKEELPLITLCNIFSHFYFCFEIGPAI